MTHEEACILRVDEGFSRFSHVQLIVATYTVAHQVPPSMGFSGQEYWSGLPYSPPGGLSNSGIEPMSPKAPALQADSLPLSHKRSPILGIENVFS